MVRQAKAQRILTHDRIWVALDRLAEHAGLSPSGLAKRAGLDPTTFNRSKRVAPDGRERWPSTESIAKALAAAGASLASFAMLLDDDAGEHRTVPLLGLGQASASGSFDEAGLPCGPNWTEVELPQAGEGRLFALKISDDALLPVYRNGDILLVAPEAPVRKGDRVVARTKAGELIIATQRRGATNSVRLRPLDGARTERTIAASEVAWLARIVWARQ